ncbi:hypothetical protein V3C99_012881, partial [Haemonchus contortus]
MIWSSLLLCSRTRIRPSTSSTLVHSVVFSSLPKAKPLEEEMLREAPQRSVLELGRKKPKKRINLVVPETELQLWTKMEPRGLLSAYLQLSKSKLTMLITSTAVAGFLLAPVSISVVPFVACTAGTALLSSSANACNQLLEAPYDAQMKRTQSRVLVVHRFSPLHALSFAGVAAVAGTATLCQLANPLAATLGVLNLVLYAGVYTPLKRTHIACTWAGAVVGAIPPLMGYAAATGTIDASALCLAAILYCWQFPHFNGLSWNLRGDYSKAGYRVMCVTDERLCRVTSIRHSLALVGLCSIAAPLTNLTTISFALDSLPVNAYLCWLAYKFYSAPDASNSRRLFFYSLLYLPLIMILMVVSNYGRSVKQKTVSE